MSPEKQRRTFLSYSRINKDFALKLAKELKSAGYLIWIDQLDIPTGARWDDELERALEESEIFMVILTPASTASDNVKDEIGYAIDNEKRILPILLKDAKVPLRLRRFQYVDFTTKSFDEGIESAKQLLKNLIEEPTIPRGEAPVDSQDKESQAEARESKEKIEGQLEAANTETESKAMQDAERTAMRKAESARIKSEQENVIKASALLIEGKRLLQNQDSQGAVQKFRQVLTLTPNHAETKKLLLDAETQILQERESADRKAKEEAERLAKQKAVDAQLAQAKAETERLAKQEADRLEVQKAEELRFAEEKRTAEQKSEMERKAKEEYAPAIVPVPVKVEAVAQPPQTAKKKGLSKPLMIGIGIGTLSILVLCAVVGVWLLIPPDPPIVEEPVVEEPHAEELIVENQPDEEIPVSGECPFDDSASVEVYIENLSSLNLDYFWIDYDCQEQYYGTLNAGEAMALSTYITHVWVFYDNQTGDYYFDYEADGGDYLAIPGNGSNASGPTVLSSAEARQLYESTDVRSFYQLANETYSEEQLDELVNNNEPIYLELAASEPLMARMGWCATTQEILEENLLSIEYYFELDGQEIHSSNRASYDFVSDDGWYCRIVYAIIDNWTSGEHSVIQDAYVSNPINDGEYDYDPGSLTFPEYFVYVP